MGIKDQVFGSKGYSTDLTLHEGEIALLESLIKFQYTSSILNKAQDCAAADIQDYHLRQLRHETMWIKKQRILTPLHVSMVRGLSFMKRLEDEFGKFGITSEEQVYPEEMYWRIVRPNEPSDVGTVHADRWFWDLGHGKRPGNMCVKVWIPIYCEPGLSGLCVVPGSHRRSDWKYHGEKPAGETRASYSRPVIDEDLTNLETETLRTGRGQCVIFNDQLLHGGIINRGTKTRISMEFMLFNDL